MKAQDLPQNTVTVLTTDAGGATDLTTSRGARSNSRFCSDRDLWMRALDDDRKTAREVSFLG